MAPAWATRMEAATASLPRWVMSTLGLLVGGAAGFLTATRLQGGSDLEAVGQAVLNATIG